MEGTADPDYEACVDICTQIRPEGNDPPCSGRHRGPPCSPD